MGDRFQQVRTLLDPHPLVCYQHTSFRSVSFANRHRGGGVYMSSSSPHKSMTGKMGRLREATLVLGGMLGVFLVCLSAFSQASQGNIQGTVFDQTGGVIPGAAVTVIDVARGISRPLATDNAGQYSAVNLTPGTYTVRVEAKGFRVTEHSGVLVEVGQTIRVDLTLQPGEQTQTVTVTGELPSIDTTDATLGGTVSNQSINALPLNGRNFLRLLTLRPGVYTDPGAGAGDASTNGGRTGTDLLLVDGVPAFGNTTGSMVIN